MIWIAVGLALVLAGAAAALVWRRHAFAADLSFRVLVLGGCLVAVIPALRTIGSAAAGAGGAFTTVHLGMWAFGLDPLSAWFLLIILGVGGATAAYGPTYLAPARGDRNIAAAHALLAVLLVALSGVVIAQSVVAFLAAWEVMALCAYLLIMYEQGDAEARRAGFIYLILTHLSTLALIAMFASVSAPGGDLSFAGIAQRRAEILPAAGPFLAFALLGFGLKAGAVPLHFWLPGAHAAAPSHVSALFSGVMIKTGIYGLFRVITLVGSPPAWWGWILLGFGLASAILGVVWALAQHDLKRLLAYHSVENIGIILMGMGVGVLGLAYGHPRIAVLGFAGALLHTLNHALFKSLLFLGAGAVVRATGTRMLDRLGGLGRRMPLTALAFGLGAVAIVGLPPLNGFVSEWVVFMALLGAGQSPDSMRIAAAATAGLALVGGLALACFTKVAGVVFLGRPRTLDLREAHDPGAGMLAPLAALAAMCLAIGLFPAIVLPPALRVAAWVAPTSTPLTDLLPTRTAAAVSMLAVVLLLLTGLLFLLRRWLRASATPRIRETWACGGLPDLQRAQYTASSYAAPLVGAFFPLAGLHEARTPSSYHAEPADPVLDGAVRPVWRVVDKAGQGIRAVQSGRIRWYLLAVVFTLVVLLLHLATRGTAR